MLFPLQKNQCISVCVHVHVRVCVASNVTPIAKKIKEIVHFFIIKFTFLMDYVHVQCGD